MFFVALLHFSSKSISCIQSALAGDWVPIRIAVASNSLSPVSDNSFTWSTWQSFSTTLQWFSIWEMFFARDLEFGVYSSILIYVVGFHFQVYFLFDWNDSNLSIRMLSLISWSCSLDLCVRICFWHLLRSATPDCCARYRPGELLRTHSFTPF